jgi:hypothetical protein
MIQHNSNKRCAALDQIRLKLFNQYTTDNPCISFDQFWYDFLIKQSNSKLSLSKFYENYVMDRR